jgi:hypothetical protein
MTFKCPFFLADCRITEFCDSSRAAAVPVTSTCGSQLCP